MKLKESPNHSEAFEYSYEQYVFGKMEFIFQTFFYLSKLYQLNQKAVSIKFTKGYNDEGIFFCYLMPIEDDEDDEEYTLVPHIIETKLHLAHTQEKAAKFCKVKERTLQRWMKDGLRSFKLGKQRIFIESDLWDYMTERAVGNLWKEMPDYIPGLDVDTNPIFKS